jgi:hypothetical protein
MTLDECRQFYAQEIRFAANLKSPALIEAYRRVPREKFLGPSPWQIGSPQMRGMAAAGLGSLDYQDSSDPEDVYHNVVIALDRALDINNGQPSALACWIEALELKRGDHLYHLGCGGIVTFVAIYSCAGARDPELEPLLLKALTTRSFLGLKSVRIDAHQADDTCIMHGSAVCLSGKDPDSPAL